MNLRHVLSWSSSLSPLSGVECSSSSSRIDERGPWRRPHRSGSASLIVVCRGSNGASRRTAGSSSGSIGSNAVSSRPRGPGEQNNGNPNSNGDSEGPRERYDRYSGGDGENASRNARGSEGRFGGYRGRGKRRNREGKMHAGAYKMRDEVTGEAVLVWGVEDDVDIPMPTAEDLNWRKSTVSLPGDASEETWANLIEEESGSSGSYMVRGVEREEKDWTDNLFEENDEDDVEEDDFVHDEDYGESDSEELTENPKVAVSRAPRVKVFGRDMWGKSQVKVKVPENNRADHSSEPNLKQETVPSSDTFVQNQDSLGGDHNVGYLGVIAPPVSIDERNKNDDSEGYDRAQEFRSTDLKDDESFVVGRMTPNEDDVHDERSVPARGDNKFADSSKASKLNKSLKEVIKVAKINDGSVEGRTNDSKAVGEARKVALKTADDIRERQNKTSSGSFNPYIIDVSEDDGNRSQFKQSNDVRKSGLLDRLRSQVLGAKPDAQGRVPDDPEEATSPTAASKNEDEEGAHTSIDNTIKPPMRDLTARDTYDASIANGFFSSKSFKDVGATPELIQALSYLNVERPSQIQAMAFKPILDGKSCIIAEQTGSGKTLAYVAPLVQLLKADEARTLGESLSKKPRLLVLVPTGELAAQVLSNFRELSKGGVPCRSVVITGGFKWKTQVESLEGGADVVVATPGRLLQQLEAGNVLFDNLKSVVLDEVDILFDDEDFSKALQTINKSASIKVQYIHVTATLPVDIHDDLLERYPDCLSLMGPSLHRTAIGLHEVLVDCSGGEQDDKTPESAFANKRNALVQLVQERPVAKTIIFCNKVETCRKVENVLSRFDRSGKKITVLPYHAALSRETRLESMETFIKSNPKERLFLVCTDRASRGIDSLDVEHVVLFDFPRDPSEYIRRVGRTARGAGGTGKVFAFVVGRQVGHARRIMARNDKGDPVHDVPGSRYYYRN